MDLILFCMYHLNVWCYIGDTAKSPNIWTIINYGNKRISENHMAVGEDGIIAANVKSVIDIYSVHIE